MVEEAATFAPDFECVSEARYFVRRVLANWAIDDVEPVASLLVTELCTNSVLHARTEFRVHVAYDGASLRLGVFDGSVRAPTVKGHSRQATTGRGIPLIAACAAAWGVEPSPGGKTVWCTLERDKHPDGAPRPTLEDTTLDALRELKARVGRSGGSTKTVGLVALQPVA